MRLSVFVSLIDLRSSEVLDAIVRSRVEALLTKSAVGLPQVTYDAVVEILERTVPVPSKLLP